MKKAEKILKAMVGEKGLEVLRKGVYRQDSQSSIETIDIYLPLIVLPRTLLSWLIQNIQPVPIGQRKELPFPGKEEIIISVEKLGRDSYKADFIEDGKVIHTLDKQTLPNFGGNMLTVGEMYESFAEGKDVNEDSVSMPDTMLGMMRNYHPDLNSDLERQRLDTSHTKELTGAIGKLVDALVSNHTARESTKKSTPEESLDKEMVNEPLEKPYVPKQRRGVSSKNGRRISVDEEVERQQREREQQVKGSRHRDFRRTAKVKKEELGKDAFAETQGTSAPKGGEGFGPSEIGTTVTASAGSQNDTGSNQYTETSVGPYNVRSLNETQTGPKVQSQTDSSFVTQGKTRFPPTPAMKEFYSNKVSEMTGNQPKSVASIKPGEELGSVNSISRGINKAAPSEGGAEQPGGAAKPKAPKVPKAPIAANRDPLASANKQAQAQAAKNRGKIIKLRNPNTRQRQMVAPKTENYFAKKLNNLKVQKHEREYNLTERELYTPCVHCGVPEFAKSEDGPKYQPCACFYVTLESQSGYNIPFVEVIKKKEHGYSLRFNHRADPEIVEAFLLTLRNRLLEFKDS